MVILSATILIASEQQIGVAQNMFEVMTTDRILTALADFGVSPTDNGSLEMIVCRPASGERRLINCGELRLDEGLLGDNWRQRGSAAMADGSANPGAQITIMNSRVIAALAQDRSRWPLAGDQLYVDLDLSVDNLKPGQRLALGTAVLEVSTVPHTGCAKFTARFGHDAIRLVNSSEGRRTNMRGINTRVVQAGSFCLGDRVTKL